MHFLAIDTETTGLDIYHGCRPFLITCCDGEENQYIFRGKVDPKTRSVYWDTKELDKFCKLVRNYRTFTFLNASFDLKAIGAVCLEAYEYLLSQRIDDVGVMAHVLDNESSGKLKDLAFDYLRIPKDDEQLLHKSVVSARKIAKKLGWDIAEKGHPHMPLQKKEFPKADYWIPQRLCELHPKLVPDQSFDDWNICTENYAEIDAVRTALLHIRFIDGLKHEKLISQYEGTHQQCIKTLHRMETRGLPVLPFTLGREIRRYKSEITENTKLALKVSGPINLNSPKQLTKLLYGDWKCPSISQTATGNESTDYATLKALLECPDIPSKAKKFLAPLIVVKKNKTAVNYLSAYAHGMIGRRLYPSINQIGTHTLRVSMSNPNGQNIGKGSEDFYEEGAKDFVLRDVFGPIPGTTWFPIDYSQLQLRIFAYATQEDLLIQAFLDGWDFHAYVASRIFGTDNPTDLQRRIAKNVNFALIFGAGRRKVDVTAGMPGAYDLFRKQFPNVDPFMESTLAQVRRHGFVKTLGGYRLWVPAKAPYKGVNYIVQGTEGELVKEAMVRCEHYLDEYNHHCPLSHEIINGELQVPRMILQVHDELIFEVPKKMPTPVRKVLVSTLATIMEESAEHYGVIAPAEASIVTKRWSNAKKYLSSEDNLHAT